MGIFCSFFFFFLILIWSFCVCTAAFSPDANNEENVLSDKGEISEIKTNERGKLEMGATTTKMKTCCNTQSRCDGEWEPVPTRFQQPDEAPTSGVEGSGWAQKTCQRHLEEPAWPRSRACSAAAAGEGCSYVTLLAGAGIAAVTHSVLESADCWFHSHEQGCSSPLREWEDSVSENHRIIELEVIGRGWGHREIRDAGVNAGLGILGPICAAGWPADSPDPTSSAGKWSQGWHRRVD